MSTETVAKAASGAVSLSMSAMSCVCVCACVCPPPTPTEEHTHPAHTDHDHDLHHHHHHHYTFTCVHSDNLASSLLQVVLSFDHTCVHSDNLASSLLQVVLSYDWGVRDQGSFPVQDRVVRFAGFLEQNGYRVYLDAFHADGNIDDIMQIAIERSHVVLACVSEGYARTGTSTDLEWTYACEVSGVGFD
jgi:hypothetical protein